jgi:hypothetical protein
LSSKKRSKAAPAKRAPAARRAAAVSTPTSTGGGIMPRLFVKADKEGHILAVSRIDELPEGHENPFYDETDKSVEIIEVKGSEKSAVKDMEVSDIHIGYVVDTKKKALKKKKD